MEVTHILHSNVVCGVDRVMSLLFRYQETLGSDREDLGTIQGQDSR